METVVRNIVDLNGTDRSAAERLVGHALRENQQLVIRVVNLVNRQDDEGGANDALPEWCNVYAGLSDEEIERLERAISRRLDLTRPNS